MDMNLSFSVLTANIISILLIGTLYLANRQKAEYDRDMRLLQQMMVTIGIASISDCCVYYLAGSSNIVIQSFGLFERIRALFRKCNDWIFVG